MIDLIPGIYKIESKIHPDRTYIGSAVDILKRWNHHIEDLIKNKHGNNKLQNHFNKYGRDDLMFAVLHCCPKEELINAEQFFIDSYNPFFNIAKIAGSSLGVKHSEEVRKRNGDARRGKKLGPASEERKRKIREWNIGRKMKPEDKKKMSIARKGKSPWNKGTHGLYTEEYRAKLREKRKTFRHTEESKRKISESQKGHIAYNKGMNAWNKGIKMSDEFRLKMSLSRKGKKLINGHFVTVNAN